MNYIAEMFNLEDKKVVITGGGGVIAGALSEALLKAGARVTLWDIAGDAIEKAKALLTESTGAADRLFGMVVDTMAEEPVRKAIEQTESSMGAPNVLINAAGGNRGKSSFVDSDMETFEFVLKLNLVAGLMVPTKVMAAYWIEKKIEGAVINLASMASYVPLSGVWAYDAAKAGVLNLTLAAAKEFAPHGIRVNAVAPGFFIGKQNKALLIKNDKTGELTDRGQSVIDHTPFGRFGDVKELAGAVIFLASEKASGFVTGVSLPVDGGYLVHNI